MASGEILQRPYSLTSLITTQDPAKAKKTLVFFHFLLYLDFRPITGLVLSTLEYRALVSHCAAQASSDFPLPTPAWCLRFVSVPRDTSQLSHSNFSYREMRSHSLKSASAKSAKFPAGDFAISLSLQSVAVSRRVRAREATPTAIIHQKSKSSSPRQAACRRGFCLDFASV